MSIVKKSLVYIFCMGLALNAQQNYAMKPQASTTSSWLKIGLGVAAGALAVVYAIHKWEKLVQEEAFKKDKSLPLATKNKRLIEAVEWMYYKDMKYWIDCGADVNDASSGRTALEYCIHKNDDNVCSCMRLLLDSGANSNTRVYNKRITLLQNLVYFLINSSMKYTKEKIELLLQYGVNLQDGGYTVFDYLANQIQFCRDAASLGLYPSHPDFGDHNRNLKECLAVRDLLSAHLLRDITSRNARRNKVEEVARGLIGKDPTFILNQYLGNEDPTKNVG